jgi:Lamin Tail Domain
MFRQLSILAGGAILAMAFAVAPSTAPTASAAGCVQISKISYDSPGSDTGANSSLNAEWVQLHNRCATAKSLSGWTIRDVASHVYKFGSYTLKAGGYVKVHTGRGSNTGADRYWGQGWYIWNNTGDTATLKAATGSLLDSCRFSGGGATVAC